MIGARRRQDPNGSSFSSTCTSISSNPRWSEVSSTSPLNPALLSPQRSASRTSRRFILPLVPASWLPVSPTSSPRAALRDLCLPRQEPRPPADVLNRSNLGSCSPSLAKFSRTSVSQQVSTSTSTTTLPSSIIQPGNFLHPTMTYLTVNGLKTQYHHQHHHHHHRQQQTCRHTTR
ncbi:unnamed protein product [Adineta steineri]|uniref:Uncharacterized protein n=1 Tax=Adineta steineri TaxID=433720 RepID=A0A818Q2C7_9BILA|nr:unnamed protein product [Adineta steineri]CAF3634600.1 unnamed protein product [Adineta steineri]